MDYEIGFKMLITLVLGYFWFDKRIVREDIKELQNKSNGHEVDVAILKEQMKSIKSDTKYIRAKLEK